MRQLLSDENIIADVVAAFGHEAATCGRPLRSGLIGRVDPGTCAALHRVVVTHDLAFGKVDIRGGA